MDSITFVGPPITSVAGVGALTLGGFLGEVAATHAEREALVFDDPLRDGDDRAMDLRRAPDTRRTAIAAGLMARGVGHSHPGRPSSWATVPRPSPPSSASPSPVAWPCPSRRSPPPPSSACLLGPLGGGRRAHPDPAARRPTSPTTSPPLVGRRRPARSSGGARRSATRAGTALLADGRRPRRRRSRPAPSTIGPGRPRARSSSARARPARPRACCTSTGRRPSSSGCRPTCSGARPTRAVWAPLPLFWTAGFTTAMGATLAGGGCFVLQETFDAGDALRLLERERVTEPYTLPHQARALSEHPDWDSTDLSALREVYGKSVFTRHPSVHGDTSWTMPIGYGMSETCAIVASHRWDTTQERDEGQHRSAPPRRAHAGRGPRHRCGARPRPGRRARRRRAHPHGPLRGPDPRGVPRRRRLLPHRRRRLRRRRRCPPLDGPADRDDQDRRRQRVARRAGGRPASVPRRASGPSRRAARRAPRRDRDALRRARRGGRRRQPTSSRRSSRARVARYKVPRIVLFFAPGELPTTGSDTKVRDDELIAMAIRRRDDASTTIAHAATEET